MFGALAAGLGAGLLGGLLQSGTGLATGLYGISQSEESNKRSTREAARQFDENMAWQREQFAKMVEMSNTAHQREVSDLRAAGLNPILSAGGSGAPTVSSVGSPSPTASMHDLDLSSSLKLIQDSVNSAIDSTQKSVDLASMAGLREAQAAQALSQASQNKELTPAMKSELLQRANSASAAANYHTTLAVQAETLTPLQAELLREKTATEQATALGRRIENRWIDRKNQMDLIQKAAQTDFLKNQQKVNSVNAATRVLDTTLDAIYPPRQWRSLRDFNRSFERRFDPNYRNYRRYRVDDRDLEPVNRPFHF